MPFSNAVSLTFIWIIWMKSSSVRASRLRPMLLLSPPPSSSPQVPVRFFFLPLGAHVMLASPSLLPRWQFSSQGLSLRSRTTHDPSWVSPYAALLCWSRWSPIPPSATHATSPRLQSSFAPHVPAPPTAHSLPASSSGPPSVVFCCSCTRHQRRGPRLP
jgi:hypothetical protein